MSMITKQIKRLKAEADLVKCTHAYTATLLREAADTIEQLAAKVRAENNKSQPCENAILIPGNATNGDVIKTIIPMEDYYGKRAKDFYHFIGWNFPEWWNAPYKRGETE